jgi:hypothetical protein
VNSAQLESLSVKIDGLSAPARRLAMANGNSFRGDLDAADELAIAGITSHAVTYAAALLKAESEDYTPWYE